MIFDFSFSVRDNSAIYHGKSRPIPIFRVFSLPPGCLCDKMKRGRAQVLLLESTAARAKKRIYFDL
jgi:hypothetical protein